MHELAIAELIVNIAAAHAGERQVSKVELKAGHLRQVVPSALEFSFELVAKGTVVEGAELEIDDVPAAGICRTCGVESTLVGFPLLCEACGGFDLEVIRGEELLVESLELEDALTTTSGGSTA